MPRKKAKWQLLRWEDVEGFRVRSAISSDGALAEALDVSVGSIAGWKHGVRAPSLRVQRLLAAKVAEATPPEEDGVSKRTVKAVEGLLALCAEVRDPKALLDAAALLLGAR